MSSQSSATTQGSPEILVWIRFVNTNTTTTSLLPWGVKCNTNCMHIHGRYGRAHMSGNATKLDRACVGCLLDCRGHVVASALPHLVLVADLPRVKGYGAHVHVSVTQAHVEVWTAVHCEAEGCKLRADNPHTSLCQLMAQLNWCTQRGPPPSQW